jgi:GTP-binding protein
VAHVALVGRSNVGKSSLINALCRSTLARASVAPGKTRLANIYRASLDGGPGGPGRWDVYLVDLPGYGYARGGATAATELKAIAEAYFARTDSGARNLSSASAALLLVDSRHPALQSDVGAAGWLESLNVTYYPVATKIDKLSQGDRAKHLRTLEETFGTAALPVSAASGEGLEELWKLIARLSRKK